MNREYLVFGSNDDGKTLSPIGLFEASDHDAAKKKAREHASFTAYGSTPAGNWSFGKLMVREIVDIEQMELPFSVGQQMTATDVIDEIEREKAEARAAIEADPAPSEDAE
jgi:hypothetical protein